MINSTEAINPPSSCQNSVLESVRQFGLVYFSILIVFGTIGNILSLLVIQGVGQTRRGQSYRFRKRMPESSIANRTFGETETFHPIRRTSSTPNLIKPASSYLGYIQRERPSLSPGIIKRAPLRKHPSRHIFTALAVTDTIVLWVNPVRYWLLFAFGIDIRQGESVFMCRIHTFLTYGTRDAAIWVLCLLTFERFLIGCFPHKAKMIWRGKRKIAAWLGIFTVILAKNSLLIFILQLMYANDVDDLGLVARGRANVNATRIVICDTEDLVTRKVFFYLDIVVYSLIPTCLLLVLNAALFRVIHRTVKMRKGYALPSKQYRPRISKGGSRNIASNDSLHKDGRILRGGSRMVKRSVIQANRLLIPVSLFHLLTSVPICIFSIIEDAMHLKMSPSPRTRCRVNACGYLFVMLGSTNYGVNCILYFLSSKHFRGRLYELTSKFCWFSRPIQRSPSLLEYTASLKYDQQRCGETST